MMRLLKLPRLWGRKAERVSVEAAVASVKGATFPFVFCFGCRDVVPSRPCAACDAETELFVVTTETDRRLVLNRLSAEGAHP